MKNGLSLVQLAETVTAQQERKKDYVASTRHMNMNAEGKLRIGDDIEVQVNRHAHTQIAQHLGIPQKYYDLMKSEAPDLLATNVNTWFAKNDATRMVRTLDGNCRAVLSNGYRAMENFDLCEAAIPVLHDAGVAIMSCSITETRLYIKAVDKSVCEKLPAGAKFGDGSHHIIRALSPAITISNSEVGCGALSVLTGVYDGFCTNLATFGERSLRKYHVGSKHEIGDDTYQLLSDKTKRLTDAALWSQVRDVVKAAFDRAKFDAIVHELKAAQADEITGDVAKVVEITAKNYHMTEDERGSVLRHLIKGGDLSRFGLHNAITRTAEDLGDYDRASEFERTGGKIIELPRSEWSAILKAAA